MQEILTIKKITKIINFILRVNIAHTCVKLRDKSSQAGVRIPLILLHIHISILTKQSCHTHTRTNSNHNHRPNSPFPSSLKRGEMVDFRMWISEVRFVPLFSLVDKFLVTVLCVSCWDYGVWFSSTVEDEWVGIDVFFYWRSIDYTSMW